MTRVFLKLYLFLILPLVLMAMLPQSPLNILGKWWFENQIHHEYGAIYPLIKEELDLIPQSQWEEKVTSISKHFAYPLLLKKRHEIKLDKNTLEKLDDPNKAYAVTKYRQNRTLIFSIDNTDYLLLASLYSRATRLEEFEKDTRGFRYFLNKKIEESENPIKEFDRTAKQYFTFDLKMYSIEDFKKLHSDHDNADLVSKIIENNLFVDYKKSNLAYLLSNNKKYIVTIKGVHRKSTYARYYKILTIILPALLLAIGALIWMILFRKEFKKVNKVAKSFGDGNFDTRINLSKNSALYPIAGSFNDMATRIQTLVNGHRDLTNAVSHELKTPLSRLHFALEMQKESKTEEERDIYTHKIENNIAALENLVDELLGYTRMQRQQTIKLEKHAIKKWLNKEVKTFAGYHPEIEVTYDNHIDQDLAFDPHLMSRALNNLLNNAASHQVANTPLIKVSAKIDSNEISLTVEDNGNGIEANDCENIFEPFTRLDKSRQRTEDKHQKGYGMGLAIVKSIILQHKGRVTCSKSSLGGAKFDLIWPVE